MKFGKRLITAALVFVLIFSTSVVSFGATDNFKSSKPVIDAIYVSEGEHGKTVILYWDSVRGATNYQLYRSTSKNGKYVKLNAKTAKYQYHCDESVKEGKLYYYKVRATKKVSGKTVYSQFSLPRGLRVVPFIDYLSKVTVTGTKASIAVPNTSRASGFYYYYSCDGGAWKLAKTTTSKSTSFNVPKDKMFYKFKVTPYLKSNGTRYKGRGSGVYAKMNLVDMGKLSAGDFQKYCNVLNDETIVVKNKESAEKHIKKNASKLNRESFKIYAKVFWDSEIVDFQSPLVEKVFQEVMKRPAGYFCYGELLGTEDYDSIITSKQAKEIVKKVNALVLEMNFTDKELDAYVSDAKAFDSTIYDNDNDKAAFSLWDLDAAEYPNQFKTLYKKAKEIYEKCIPKNASDYEKAKALHDYLCKNMDYGYPDSEFTQYYGFELYDVLINKKGVCHHYAVAYEALCKMAGLNCMYIVGVVDNGITTNGFEDHAWNLIKLGDTWYNVDCTWDDPLNQGSNYVRYKYFLKSDQSIWADHRRKEPSNLPACPKDYK